MGSVQTFDLAKYASRPWYIQQQAATIYLPENENYCVSARYTVLEKKTLLGYDVKVRNVAYEKSGKIHDSGDLIYAKIEGKDGLCRTGQGVNQAGLWIFTRQQVRDDNSVRKVRNIAEKKGFDLTVLNDVDQTNCPPLPES